MILSFRKYLRSKHDKCFDHKLIKKLHKDHEKLLKLFLALEREIIHQSDKALKKLNKFLEELELHLLLENSKLYSHIELKYKFCELDKIKTIKEQIPQNAHLFNLLEHELKQKNYQKAQHILSAIKDFLLRRISFEEEKLYTIYMKAHSCNTLQEILKPKI